MMKRAIYITLLGLSLTLFAACGSPLEVSDLDEMTNQTEHVENGETKGNVAEAAEAETAEPTPVPTVAPSLVILADGKVVIGQPILPLSFESSGKLLTLNVQPGQKVAAGEIIGTLDNQSLADNVRSAELRVRSAESSLAAAESTLYDLENWEPDEQAIAMAEANIESAKAGVDNAVARDNAAYSGLTSANITIQQAQRELAEAQAAYDNAFSEAREWETHYTEPICETFQGEQQCQNYTWAQRIQDERKGAISRLQAAKEQLQIAQSSYAVQAASTSNNSAVSAETQLLSAEQELIRALKGPTDTQIATAKADIEQRQIALETEQFALEQAIAALEHGTLKAPWDGVVLSVDAMVGAAVGPGSTIVKLLDTSAFEFHTTNLSERDLTQIKTGQAAQLMLKSYPDEVVTGTVTRVGLQSTGKVGDAAIFPVIIQLDNDNVNIDIRAGMTGRVEILHGDQ